MKINMKIEDKDIKRVVPPLRFPEFRNAEGWGVTTLKSICKITNGKCNAQDHIEGGIYPLFDRSETRKASNSYLFDCEAVIIPGEGMRFTPKYYIGKFNLHQRAYALKDFSCIGLYIYYLMEHRSDLLSINAVKSTVLSLRLPILQDFPIETPKNLREQKKIADCLSSLDDLINAVTDKIEALKEYKKGLMQQLFPAEGKTTPTLRFPEFQNAGEWKITQLSKLGKTISGLTYTPKDIRDSGLLVLRSSNIKDGRIVLYNCVYVTENIKAVNLSKPNDILICVRNGSEALIGKNALIPYNMPLCTHGAFMTVFRAENPRFIFQLFQTDAYQKQVNANLGARINSINNSQLNKYQFAVPTLEEQKKLADFLSSVDELISAETDKLDQLKVHKKGLMQQLFPTLNE